MLGICEGHTLTLGDTRVLGLGKGQKDKLSKTSSSEEQVTNALNSLIALAGSP